MLQLLGEREVIGSDGITGGMPTSSWHPYPIEGRDSKGRDSNGGRDRAGIVPPFLAPLPSIGRANSVDYSLIETIA